MPQQDRAKAELLEQLIEEAVDTIDELEREAAVQRSHVAILTAKLRKLVPEGEADEADAQTPVSAPRATVFDAEDDRKIPMQERLVEVLRETRRPMRLNEFLAALKAQGVKTGAKKGLLPAVVTALSRRKDLFDKVERGLYGLVEWGNNGRHPE